MQPTVIIRHRKENLKKCSLRGLETHPDMHFITYPFSSLPSLEGYVMLVMEGAPLLSQEDVDKGLLLLDSSWRYLPKMVGAIDQAVKVEKRCLPPFLTAYPRDPNPQRGLATVEALYCAFHILKKTTIGLLDHYYWKNRFIELNSFDF